MDRFVLKWIALCAMIIDHIGAIFYPEIVGLRLIGRLAFPIFAFLIAEGFFYTSDVKQYMKRLFYFALVSEIPFDLAFRGSIIDLRHQNVYFTLFTGVLMLYVYQRQYSTAERVFCLIIGVLSADLLFMDYGGWGILMIFCFYHFRDRALLKYLLVALINIVAFGNHQAFATFALIPIALYNGKRGRPMKYFFYAAYPIHLLLFALIQKMI